MNFDDKAFGERIRKLRQAMGISRDAMAEKLMVTENYLGKVERGMRRPSYEFVILFSDTFDVSLDYLMRNQVSHRTINETALLLAEQLQLFISQNSTATDNPSLNSTTSP